jgi:hypothetical protein
MTSRICLILAGLLAGQLQVIGQGIFASNSYAVGPTPTCVVAVDVNGDGKLDLVSANNDSPGSGGSLTVLTNNGSGVFGFNATLTAGKNPYCVVAADVNGDGKVDLISANAGGDNTLTVLTNNGSGGFALSATLPTGNTGNSAGGYPFWVAAADLNGDGKIDLISANFFANTLTVLTNNGSGVFGSNATLNVGGGPAFVLAVDVNGDGKLDLISVNYESRPLGNTLSIYTNNGSGVFGSNATVYAGPNPKCVVPIDIKSDGKPDLVVANENPNWLTVLTNNGSGVFGSNATLNVGSYPASVVAADIYGDGSPELICANTGGTLTVMTNNGSGGFGSNATINVNPLPVCVIAADVNGDARPDLITANYDGSGTLTVLLNASIFPTPASTPTLSIKPAGNGMLVSWPSASAGWSLQQNPDLTTANWGPSGYSGHPIADNGTNKSLAVTPPLGNSFFRLMHP